MATIALYAGKINNMPELIKDVRKSVEKYNTRKQFLDEYNNPNHYRPELPSYNRSHVGEDLTDLYLGP